MRQDSDKANQDKAVDNHNHNQDTLVQINEKEK
jgi:hypothetical protein